MNRRPGVRPLGNGAVSGSDAETLFFEAVDEKLKLGMSKPDAVRAIARERPELHAAYVEAHNARVGPSTYRGPRA